MTDRKSKASTSTKTSTASKEIDMDYSSSGSGDDTIEGSDSDDTLTSPIVSPCNKTKRKGKCKAGRVSSCSSQEQYRPDLAREDIIEGFSFISFRNVLDLETFVHCKDKSAIKLLSCSDEESTHDVPSSSASKKSKFKKSVDANNQRRIQQKKQNNVGHTKQSDDFVRSSLSSPKKTDPLQSPKLTSADTHESNLSESEKENNITTNMVGAGANVDLFPMLSPRVSILPVMSPHAIMPRLLTLNNDNDATRSLSPASSSGTLNENSCDSRSAFIVECKEPIVVTPLEYDDSNFEDDDKDLNHRSLKRPGEQLEEPSKRLAWNSEDIIDKTCLNGALSEMQCETEKKMISLPVSCKPYQNSLNEILAVDSLVKKESKDLIVCSETSRDGSHSTIHSSATVEVYSSANVPCSVESNKGPLHDWNGDHYNSEKFNKNKMEIKMECEFNPSKASTPDVVLIFDSESESQHGMKPISIRADTVTPRSDHNSPRFSSISSKRSSADVIVLPSSQPSKVHVIDDKPVRRVRLSAYGRDLSPDTILHGCARTDIKLECRTPVATTPKSHHKEYSQKSSSRPPMPELIPTSAATVSSSQPSFSKSSFVDALPPFRPPSFHSHRSPPPPGLCLPMPTMAPQSGMGSLHQPMVMPPMPGWGQLTPQFEMLAAQLAANQEMLRVQQGLNERFLQDGRLRPMPILGGHLGLNGLPLGLPGMPTLTLRTEMHQHQHLHHHQHVVPAYIPPSNPMPVMQTSIAPSVYYQPNNLHSSSSLPNRPTFASRGAFMPMAENKASLPASQLLASLRNGEYNKSSSAHRPGSGRGRWCAAHVQIAWQILMHSRQQRQHKQQYDPPSGGGRDARMDPMHRGMASTPDFRLGAAADREMRQNPLLATGNLSVGRYYAESPSNVGHSSDWSGPLGGPPMRGGLLAVDRDHRLQEQHDLRIHTDIRRDRDTVLRLGSRESEEARLRRPQSRPQPGGGFLDLPRPNFGNRDPGLDQRNDVYARFDAGKPGSFSQTPMHPTGLLTTDLKSSFLHGSGGNMITPSNHDLMLREMQERQARDARERQAHQRESERNLQLTVQSGNPYFSLPYAPDMGPMSSMLHPNLDPAFKQPFSDIYKSRGDVMGNKPNPDGMLGLHLNGPTLNSSMGKLATPGMSMLPDRNCLNSPRSSNFKPWPYGLMPDPGANVGSSSTHLVMPFR